MGVLLVLIVCAAVLALYWFIAKEFYSIACQKGHTEKKYFWWCFWCSFVGYAMVIALPDRSKGAGSASLDNLPTL